MFQSLKRRGEKRRNERRCDETRIEETRRGKTSEETYIAHTLNNNTAQQTSHSRSVLEWMVPLRGLTQDSGDFGCWDMFEQVLNRDLMPGIVLSSNQDVHPVHVDRSMMLPVLQLSRVLQLCLLVCTPRGSHAPLCRLGHHHCRA